MAKAVVPKKKGVKKERKTGPKGKKKGKAKTRQRKRLTRFQYHTTDLCEHVFVLRRLLCQLESKKNANN